MAKISFFLVFSIVLALPFRSVIGQDWNELVGQAGLTQTLDEAKKAIGAANGIAGAAAGQEALNDYFSGSEDVADAGASLADWIDTDGNTTTDPASPSAGSTDSPVGAPEDLPADSDDLDDDDDDSLSPEGAPQQAPTSAPSESPISEAPEYAAPTNAPSRAPPANAPKLAPTNAPAEAPKDDDEKPPGYVEPGRADDYFEVPSELDPMDPDYVAPPKGAPAPEIDD